MNVKERITQHISALPTLPTIIHRLLSAANDEETGMAELSRIIAFDAALTANVLRAANSAHFGFVNTIESLPAAAARLGTAWMVQTALSSLVNAQVRRPAAGYDLTAQELWLHSAAVAIMSDRLCKLLKIHDGGTIYTAALLHDIGKIALGEFLVDSLEETQAEIDQSESTFEEAETKVLGVNHAQVGALIGARWGFPELLCETIEMHHTPGLAKKSHPIVDIVHVADALCLMGGFGLGRDGLQYRIDEAAVERLGLSDNLTELAISQSLEILERVEEMVNELPQTPARRT